MRTNAISLSSPWNYQHKPKWALSNSKCFNGGSLFWEGKWKEDERGSLILHTSWKGTVVNHTVTREDSDLFLSNGDLPHGTEISHRDTGPDIGREELILSHGTMAPRHGGAL